jgi:hypothetical protein
LILASDRHFPKGDTPLMGYSFTWRDDLSFM